MLDTTGMAIVLMCTNLTLGEPKYNTACQKSVEATTIELDIKSKAELVQKFVEKQVIQYTGNEIWIVSGVGYHYYQTNELMYSFPVKPIADNVSFQTNTKDRSWNLGLSWSFQ